jgi:hypothetical protein
MTLNSRSAKLSSPNVKVQDVPDKPTIGTAVVNVDTIQVPFTPATTGGQAAVYRAVSSPGGIEAISFGSSPISVPNLDDGVARTFTVRGETSTGATTGFSAASNSVTVPRSAMELIATAKGDGTTTNNIGFNSIPQGYQDLMLVINSKVIGSSTNYYGIAVNGTRTNYSNTVLAGNGSSAYSYRGTGVNQLFLTTANNLPAGSTSPASSVVHILNYTNSTSYKTLLWRTAFDQNGSGASSLHVGLFTGSTAAITSINIQLDTGSTFYTSDSTFTLYGIKAVGQ